MQHRPLRAAWLLLLALVIAGCTAGNEAAVPPPPPGAPASPAPGATAPVGGDAEAAARAWLEGTYQLDADTIAGLQDAEVTTSPGVSHVRFAQRIDDVPVVGGEIVVHVLENGEVQNATDELVEAEASETAQEVDEATAIDNATKAIEGEPSSDPTAELVYLQDGMTLRLAWRVVVATVEPVSSWTVVVDAGDGTVISADEASTGRHGRGSTAVASIGASVGLGPVHAQAQAGGDACEVTESPGACVFRPDPIYAAGGELSDMASANDFLEPVALQGLSDPTALVGEFANLEPEGAPVEPTREEDGTWAGGRATRGFEAAMAYYWIDNVQRQIQALGFTDVRNEPFPVFPLDPDVVDNAFYSPAEDAVHLGVGSDGVNEGEDASGIIHEYGHAVLDQMVPGLLGGTEGGAYHESFGDLLAFLTTLEFRAGDAGCLFAWAEAGECLRRVDSDKVYPDDLIQEVHADGEIYNGAVYDVLEGLLAAEGVDLADCAGSDACNATRDRVLATLIASNNYVPNDASLPDVAEAFILANEASFAGADAEIITDAFAAHGLTDGVGSEMIDSAGQPMGTSGVAVAVDIAHSYRGDLSVSVGVAGADFVDLCEPIVLFEPDENDDADNLFGEVDISDSECAAFVPPSPDQLWYLRVEDTLAEDEGEILGFAVIDGEAPYLAPGLPVPIRDADPAASFAIIDGTGEAVPQSGTEAVSDTVEGDGPFITVAISHTYNGDLAIGAGVADASGSIICSVPVLEPDASDSGDGLAGDVDLSACAEFYPPSADQQWFLQVIDTAAADTGTVDQFTLTGADGETFDFADVPVEIPDADEDGVALLLSGSGGGESGQAGGSGTSSTAGLPAASVTITHPYSGDLAVTAGVVDSGGDVLCEVVVATPDQNNSEPDLAVDASLEDCAAYYPPSAEQRWYLFAADTLAADVGTVDGFTIVGPDGVTYTSGDVPVELPDADPEGVVLLLDGSEASGGSSPQPGGDGDVVVAYDVEHSYAGDLQLTAGVADASGDIVCEVTIVGPDSSNSDDSLSGLVSLAACDDFYPPSGDTIWYLNAEDTVAADEGSIVGFAIQGPDGTVFESPDVPVAIPDDDPSGAAAFIRG